MKKAIHVLGVLALISLLFLIRAFEGSLFYDPLILYFQNDYLYQEIPVLNEWKLILNLFYRYVLNSIISLGIIYLIFKKKNIVKFSGFFLMIAFVILIFFFAVLLRGEFQSGYLLPFYIRRFIIHPIFLFLLLPTFYYQQKQQKL